MTYENENIKLSENEYMKIIKCLKKGVFLQLFNENLLTAEQLNLLIKSDDL